MHGPTWTHILELKGQADSVHTFFKSHTCSPLVHVSTNHNEEIGRVRKRRKPFAWFVRWWFARVLNLISGKKIHRPKRFFLLQRFIKQCHCGVCPFKYCQASAQRVSFYRKTNKFQFPKYKLVCKTFTCLYGMHLRLLQRVISAKTRTASNQIDRPLAIEGLLLRSKGALPLRKTCRIPDANWPVRPTNSDKC